MNESGSVVQNTSYARKWGEVASVNQPRSRADPVPPPTVLKYSKDLSQDLVSRQKEHAQQRYGLKQHGRYEENEIDRAIKNLYPSDGKDLLKSRKDSDKSCSQGSQWSIKPAVRGNVGLINAVKSAMSEEGTGDVYWLGTLSFPTDSLEDNVKEAIRERLEMEFDTLAVYISDTDLNGHYDHYCRTILWPVLHYQIPDHPKSKAYEDHSWKYYVNVNRAIANKLVRSYKRGDIVWVHDYHLLLLPGMVREKLPDAKVGFFLHSAFPSSEVFRCLSVRKQLLEGMLGANLIVFQTHEYATHFLQTCNRLLTVEIVPDGIQLENRFVNVAWLAIGIDPVALNRAREEPAVEDSLKVLRERYKDKRLIVARDKLDNVRGVRQKLLAYELFLHTYPEWREKVRLLKINILVRIAYMPTQVVLIQVGTPMGDQSDHEAAMSDIVTRIASIYSNLDHQPLIFLRQDITFSQYLALLTSADLMLSTGLREGMNLTAHEFIVCQDGQKSDKKHGPLILSEFTGSSSTFEENDISVNPWHYRQVAVAIKTALEMPAKEKEDRHKKLHSIVTHNTGGFWFSKLNEMLEKVYKEHLMRDSTHIPRLSHADLSENYRKSTKRLFILDYEGTLAPIGSDTNVALMSPQRVLDCLTELLRDERNIVYVMSDRQPEELERLFSRVSKLGIIAENGCFLREYGKDGWVTFADPAAMESWKGEIRRVLQYYVERLEGSWVESRHCSLIFHYEKAEDVDYAVRQAGDCANHIDDACESQRVHAVPIDKSILVEPIDWNKGTAADYLFKRFYTTNLPAGKEKSTSEEGVRKEGTGMENVRSKVSPMLPDFVMVAGNDREDEPVFKWANKLRVNGDVRHVTTVSTGNRNTEAMFSITQGATGKNFFSLFMSENIVFLETI